MRKLFCKAANKATAEKKEFLKVFMFGCEADEE